MDNAIQEKSFSFAIRVVNLSRYLVNEKKEYVLSRQILKSGTSIGANAAEARRAQSRADFISKMNISLKETTETLYWLRLLEATDYLSKKQASALIDDRIELEKILVSIINTSKNN